MAYDTVRQATAPELAYVRSAGQWSKLYLATFQPVEVFSCLLLDVPESNDQVVEVTYDTPSGDYLNVRKDMTLYVGSTAGGYDLGVVRIRKAPTDAVIYIGETSDVDWGASGTVYLTVVNDFDFWARHINTVSDSDFRMDWDITYVNQNAVFDPIPVMGGHRVIKRTGSSVGTLWNFSNSWVIGSTITGYSTSCPTASSVVNGSTATPTINFNADGWHPVYLTVTAANTKTYTGVRYVYVYSASSMPSAVFQLGECSVDYDTGGWAFEVTVQSGIELAAVPERALCILFAEDYYAGTNVSVGQLAGCENIIAVGKIATERMSLKPMQSEVTLAVEGMHYWMNRVGAFPTGVLSVEGTPTNWAEMQSPTVQKVLYRALHWGSTATTIMDVYITDDTRPAVELVSASPNMWAQMTDIAFATIHARPGVDRFGRLFVQIEPQVTPAGQRTYPSVMTITNDDWSDEVSIERVVVTPTGRVDLSGVTATSSDDGQAFFSLSTGHIFKHYGIVETIDRLLLSTQALSNQLAGLFMGWRNNPFPNVEFSLIGNNRMIDCFPRQKVSWSIAQGDTPRGFEVSGYWIPRRVSFSWDADTGFLETSLSLELESVEDLSVNGDIPGETGDISLPPVPPILPPPPPPPIIIPGEIPSDATMKGIMHSTTYGLLFTENFNDETGADVEWRTINAGLTSAQYLAINFIMRNPYTGELYVAKRNRTGFGVDPFLAYAPSPGSAFTLIETPSTIWSKLGTTTNAGVNGIGYNPLTGQVGYIISNDSEGRLFIGNGVSFVTAGAPAAIDCSVAAIGNLSFGDNMWRFTGSDGGSGSLWKFSAAGVYSAPKISYTSFYMRHHTPIGSGDTFYVYPFLFTSNIIKRSDMLGNVTLVGDEKPFVDWDYSFACDPSGVFCMLDWDTGRRGKSSDGLATIVTQPALPFESGFSFWYIGGAGMKSHWAACAGQPYYTKDFGGFWSDQSGNIYSQFPLGGFTNIKAWF